MLELSSKLSSKSDKSGRKGPSELLPNRDKERRDLKPVKEAIEAGLLDVEMSHAVSSQRDVSQVLRPGTYPAFIGKHMS